MADTLAGRIQVAITAQQAEVDRLTIVATTELQSAQQRLNQLNNLLARATPQVETLFATLLNFHLVD